MKRLVVASFLLLGTWVSAAPTGKLTHQQDIDQLARGFTYLPAKPATPLHQRSQAKPSLVPTSPEVVRPESTVMREHQALARLVTPTIKIEEFLPLIWVGIAIIFLPLLSTRKGSSRS